MSIQNYSEVYEVDEERASTLPYSLPNFLDYTDIMKVYTIKPGQQYRPDKIAMELYNDQNKSYLLDLINNFSHIKEYYINRDIVYIPKNKLSSIGV